MTDPTNPTPEPQSTVPVEPQNLVSPLHPHEPHTPPIIDDEGRCWVCGVEVHLQDIGRIVADLARNLAARQPADPSPEAQGLIPFDPTEPDDNRRERQTALSLGLPGFYVGNSRRGTFSHDLCSEHGWVGPNTSIAAHLASVHGIELEDYHRRVEAASPSPQPDPVGLAAALERLDDELPGSLAEDHRIRRAIDDVVSAAALPVHEDEPTGIDPDAAALLKRLTDEGHIGSATPQCPACRQPRPCRWQETAAIIDRLTREASHVR